MKICKHSLKYAKASKIMQKYPNYPKVCNSMQKFARNKFYEKLSHFARLLKMALSSVEFVTNTDDKKMKSYKKDALFFLKLRRSMGVRANVTQKWIA